MKDESLKSQSIDLVLRTILEQVTRDFADVADDRWSCWLKDKRNDWFNIIDYWNHHWQWSSAFVRYNRDFDDDSATFAA